MVYICKLPLDASFDGNAERLTTTSNKMIVSEVIKSFATVSVQPNTLTTDDHGNHNTMSIGCATLAPGNERYQCFSTLTNREKPSNRPWWEQVKHSNSTQWIRHEPNRLTRRHRRGPLHSSLLVQVFARAWHSGIRITFAATLHTSPLEVNAMQR